MYADLPAGFQIPDVMRRHRVFPQLVKHILLKIELPLGCNLAVNVLAFVQRAKIGGLLRRKGLFVQHLAGQPIEHARAGRGHPIPEDQVPVDLRGEHVGTASGAWDAVDAAFGALPERAHGAKAHPRLIPLQGRAVKVECDQFDLVPVNHGNNTPWCLHVDIGVARQSEEQQHGSDDDDDQHRRKRRRHAIGAPVYLLEQGDG